MQKLQALHCNAEGAGSTLYFRIIRRYTVMQKYKALQYNAKATGAAQ
jgi:hypothetical protein